jgi:dienelactone hydrolase
VKDLDGYFPFQPSGTPEEWAKRAERIRRQMQVTLGLWPMPAKTPLNAVIHGKIDQGDYTVEKVYFESIPGFFVTGNLYRPKGKSGKVPGVLCPHGHWAQGRFMDFGPETIKQHIVQGAERFEEGGRSVLQSRCVQLARMGCVAFHYDMIGYADSLQIPMAVAHEFKTQRPEMNTPEEWGLFSPRAESHYQSVMGLQTWDSIRALDFLLGLPEVDPQRVAVTGASGGGTQTFILCALDPRPAVSFPAVMVSTAMQGGCTCENASGLRIGTGNVEFAALFAPKPQGLTAADDWTKEMATKGFPELKQHYSMLGAADKVMLKPLLHFEHNYNYVSRAALYGWLNRHLSLGLKEPVVEQDYPRLSREQMTVWDAQHPAPPGGPEFEKKLVAWLTQDAQKQLKEAQKSPEAFRSLAGSGVDIVIGRSLAEAGDVVWDMKAKNDRGGYLEMVGLLRNTTHGEEIPVIFLYPKEWNKQTVLWIDRQGKGGLYAESDSAGTKLRPEIQRLLDGGATVVGIDLLYQGEFLPDGKPVRQTRRVKNPRESAAYTFGYNHSLFAQRVHDILTVIQYVRSQDRKSELLDLVGLEGAGWWAAAARAQAKEAVDRAVVDTGGFRFGNIRDLRDPHFLPGGAKYGDLPGMLALGAPSKLVLLGEGGTGPEVVRSAYANAKVEKNLTVVGGEKKAANEAALKLLLQRGN